MSPPVWYRQRAQCPALGGDLARFAFPSRCRLMGTYPWTGDAAQLPFMPKIHPVATVNAMAFLAGNPVNFPHLAGVGPLYEERGISSGMEHLHNFLVADHSFPIRATYLQLLVYRSEEHTSELQSLTN